MEVNFNDIKLDIRQVRQIRVTKIQNYTDSKKFHFPSGAIEVGTYYSNIRNFQNLREFVAYVLAMPYMNFDCYEFPDDNISFELNAIDANVIKTMITGSFNTFLDFSRNDFWNLSLATEGVVTALQLNTIGAGLTVFFETSSNYVCFYEQPID